VTPLCTATLAGAKTALHVGDTRQMYNLVCKNASDVKPRVQQQGWHTRTKQATKRKPERLSYSFHNCPVELFLQSIGEAVGRQKVREYFNCG